MRKRFTTVERLEHIAREALLGRYGTISSWSDTQTLRRLVHLHCQMDCANPHEYELHARYSARHGRAVKPLTVVVHSRCRKCEPCRKRRTMFWSARAVTEWSIAPTTLFGTLTLRPEKDAEVDALARIALAERGVDFDRDLSRDEQFRARVKYAGLELTKFLKRIREGDKVRGRPEIRYLLIAEAHNGAQTSDAKRYRPHWHCLIHEQTKEARLVMPDEWARRPNGDLACDKYGNPYLADASFLKRQWEYGHSTFALCRTPQAAGYLCKYLTKAELDTRIRASFRYGNVERSGAARAVVEESGKVDSLEKADLSSLKETETLVESSENG